MAHLWSAPPRAAETSPSKTKLPTEPTAVVPVEAGDVLHAPRCWWHAATSAGEPSLHPTGGLAGRTGVDLLTWLVDELHPEQAIRQALPGSGGQDHRASWRDQGAKLVQGRQSPGKKEAHKLRRPGRPCGVDRGSR
ncbi:hypothetical protein EBO15_29630 [Actinomadura harenae]|uniref:JmjC domain-containing protein n=1 Tax=Actinomadura harenae TaxID=2483351 RepID=A0A3M2LPL7_9ACTN|nr:hypothetical protein EBO15_29630 [Actinomadura harenae]